MKAAWKQVERNKGAAGVDGRTIAETKEFLREHWPELRKQLLDETYKPYPVLRGWLNYFRPGASKRILRQLDFWVRRRLRCLIWRQWKRPGTRVRKLLSLGCSEEQSRTGWTRRGPWACAGTPAVKQTLDPAYFRRHNLFGLLENMLQRETTST